MEQTQPGRTPILDYDGRLGDLYKIFLLNLLLTVVTLGIWRFWAITRVRRYLWSRTSSGGVRFEYDGTGGQLFVGYLLALGIITGMFIVAGIAAGLLGLVRPYLAVIPFLFAYLGIVVLALGAPFSAQRYRLSHTVWRGIRGGMQGSMIKYGLRSLWYSIAILFTLFQLLPWASIRLLERRTNASSFGSERFHMQGRAGAVYGRFVLTILGIIALGAVVIGGGFAIVTVGLGLSGHDIAEQIKEPGGAAVVLIPILGYLIFGFGSALIAAGYQAAFYRHVTSHTTLGGLRFGSAVTGWDIVRLMLGNILIIVITLGLGLPIVIHRNARFFTTNLLASGALDTTRLLQSEQPISRYGEGMFQALDAGTGMM